MNSKVCRIYVTACTMAAVLIIPGTAIAQRQLSLPDAIGIARQQSYDAMVARLHFMSQYWSYRSFKAELMPSVNLHGNLLQFDRSMVETRNFDDGRISYVENNSMSNSLSLSVDQNIVALGGKLSVLSCMDTRLTELLPAALGLKNGDAKIIKNAGGLVISAFDSAMRSLIVAIYELGVEKIMVVAHSHCGACHMSYDHFHHEMIARGVTDETLDTIRKCGINLNHWLEGFKDTPESVRKTVETIKTHPLVPKDIVVRGFIIDSETGELESVV